VPQAGTWATHRTEPPKGIPESEFHSFPFATAQGRLYPSGQIMMVPLYDEQA